jgi:hypothetical protein
VMPNFSIFVEILTLDGTFSMSKKKAVIDAFERSVSINWKFVVRACIAQPAGISYLIFDFYLLSYED